MTNKELRLIQEFKRMIHALSAGKRTSINFGGCDLYRAEIHVLEIIGMKGSTTVTEIAGVLTVTKGAISQIISKLFSKRLISKTKKDNTNKVKILLTPKGKDVLKLHQKHEKVLLKSVKKKLEKFSAEEINVFASVVSEVSDFISRSE